MKQLSLFILVVACALLIGAEPTTQPTDDSIFNMGSGSNDSSKSPPMTQSPENPRQKPDTIRQAKSMPPADGTSRQPSASLIKGPIEYPPGREGHDWYTLDIKARVDGSDAISITANQLIWTHKHWSMAANVFLNNLPWDAKAHPKAAVGGGLSFLSEVDFSSVRVLGRHGRDLATVETADNGITVYFDDSPNGAGDYEILLAFRRK